MKRIALILTALMLSACNEFTVEETTASRVYWKEVKRGMHDFARVMAVIDEADDVKPYIHLTNEFVECMATNPREDRVRVYKELSPSEMAALSIWAAGNYEAWTKRDEEATEEEEDHSAYGHLVAAIGMCNVTIKETEK